MHKMIEVLQKEVAPAQGCTEPIAVAYAVSIAAEQLEGPAENVQLYLSGNIVKNALGVGIPGTGRTGIDIAALLGAVIRRSDKKLEILNGMTDRQLKEAEALLEQKILKVSLKEDTAERLYIEAVVQGGGHTGRCVILRSHTNVVLIEKDGVPSLQTQNQDGPGGQAEDHAELSVKEIYEFATTIPFEEIAFLLEGAKMNMAVSAEGLRGDYGLRVGKALSGKLGSLIQPTLGGELAAAAAAASDARMDGCAMPVMTTGGSGNQGISCTVAAAALAEKLGSSQEQLARALALSDLVTVHIKSYMGRLSPLCGSGIAGAAGSCCAMIYLMGGSLGQKGIQMILANHMGMICDGAKTTCALKIATGVQAAVLCATLAMENLCPCEKEGIVCKDVEDTIRGVGCLANQGVPQLDPTILQVMLDK